METVIDKTLVWIRITGLNMRYYNESLLLAITAAIGRPVKVDRNTLHANRGKFARICVEIDLSKPVIGRVCILGRWYKVEYEGLHIICKECGVYGHHGKDCLTPRNQSENEAPNGTAEPGGSTAAAAAAVQEQNQAMEEHRPVTKDKEGGGILGEYYGDWITVTRRKRNVPKPMQSAINAINPFAVLGHLTAEKDKSQNPSHGYVTAGTNTHQKIGLGIFGSVRFYAQSASNPSIASSSMGQDPKLILPATTPLTFSMGPQCDQPNNVGAGTKGVANKARRERKRTATDSQRGIIINLAHYQAQEVMQNNEQDRDITGTDNHNVNLGDIASPDVNSMIVEDPKSKPPDPSRGDMET
ncbi:uncharacterized protein A4U43_C01F31250 [Asparagus officinalis]|uniref:CCHC-type domain-containing protein n=1 Tax=Asparagus officinalis TaxID=4686 RepID=A0A5P1FVT2_ASPOF|nr:uncharacterized protein A4U43_C01F31250 [Asparagus officinalis]